MVYSISLSVHYIGPLATRKQTTPSLSQPILVRTLYFPDLVRCHRRNICVDDARAKYSEEHYKLYGTFFLPPSAHPPFFSKGEKVDAASRLTQIWQKYLRTC